MHTHNYVIHQNLCTLISSLLINSINNGVGVLALQLGQVQTVIQQINDIKQIAIETKITQYNCYITKSCLKNILPTCLHMLMFI